MLGLRALVLCAVAAWCWPASAFACKCAEPLPVADARLAADAVFEGQVTKLTPAGEHALVVELNVVRTWKGANLEQIKVQTPADSAACGFPFQVGESYLVYANPIQASEGLPALSVQHCGRTALTAESDADLSELGIGVVPVSPRSDDLPPGTAPTMPSSIDKQQNKPAAGGCASCSGAPGALSTSDALLGMLMAAACLLRMRRRA